MKKALLFLVFPLAVSSLLFSDDKSEAQEKVKELQERLDKEEQQNRALQNQMMEELNQAKAQNAILQKQIKQSTIQQKAPVERRDRS